MVWRDFYWLGCGKKKHNLCRFFSTVKENGFDSVSGWAFLLPCWLVYNPFLSGINFLQISV